VNGFIFCGSGSEAEDYRILELKKNLIAPYLSMLPELFPKI